MMRPGLDLRDRKKGNAEIGAAGVSCVRRKERRGKR